MQKRVIFILLMSFLYFTVMVSADSIDDQILNLRKQIIELQNKGKLGFRDFTLCSNILSFASYVPLKEPKVKQGGELLIYYEPKNFYTNFKNNLYEVWLTQDMIVTTMDNKVLLTKKNALNYHFYSAKPVLDIYFTNSVTIGNTPPGKYIFKAVLYDKLRNTSVTKSIVFEVVK